MDDNSKIPTKEEIIKNMAKHLQTNFEDGEEVLLRTYDLAFIKGKMEAISEMKKKEDYLLPLPEEQQSQLLYLLYIPSGKLLLKLILKIYSLLLSLKVKVKV